MKQFPWGRAVLITKFEVDSSYTCVLRTLCPNAPLDNRSGDHLVFSLKVVPRGDTPGEGEGGPDRERGGTAGRPGGVGGSPTTSGAAGSDAGGVGGVGRGDSPATGTGVGPGGDAAGVGGTLQPHKGAL